MTGRVVRVVDGDTLLLAVAGAALRVRLAGVDAPELGQPGGAEAREALTASVMGREVAATSQGRDRYGRMVARVRVDGARVDLLLVRHGWAWQDPRYSREEELARAQEEARRERRGVWRSGEPVQPWRWRREG